jgi:hypothetical protein
LPHARAGPKKGLGRERAQLIAVSSRSEIKIMEAFHGWCVSDMPIQNGMPTYSMSDAERAWGKLVVLYKTVLA